MSFGRTGFGMGLAGLAAGLALAATTARADAADYDTLFDVAEGADMGEAEVAGGNGCPYGSYDYQVSADGQYLTIRYYDFAVYARAGQSDSQSCRLRLEVRPPSGYAIGFDGVSVMAHASVQDFDSHGYIDVGYRMNYARFPADLVRRSFSGPGQGDVNVSGRLDARRVQYTSCDPLARNLVDLDSVMAVEARSRTSHAELRGTRFGGAVEHRYRIVWALCSGPRP